MLANFNDILLKAKKNKYAIPQFNINNLEWTKYILEECNKLNIPVILGVSESAIEYMGGYFVVSNLVNGLMKDLNIKIPVCLHLDHAQSKNSCIKAIQNGFTSVMIDASTYDLNTNIKITKEVVDYAHQHNVSVESEVGCINDLDNATLEDSLLLYQKTKIDSIAPALGSKHGIYKEEVNLDFSTMKKISENLPIPIVLHGGTGILDSKINCAIDCGISKININTELQIVWNKAVRRFIIENKDIYDPRIIISSGEKAIKKRIAEIVTLFRTKL